MVTSFDLNGQCLVEVFGGQWAKGNVSVLSSNIEA